MKKTEEIKGLETMCERYQEEIKKVSGTLFAFLFFHIYFLEFRLHFAKISILLFQYTG